MARGHKSQPFRISSAIPPIRFGGAWSQEYTNQFGPSLGAVCHLAVISLEGVVIHSPLKLFHFVFSFIYFDSTGPFKPLLLHSFRAVHVTLLCSLAYIFNNAKKITTYYNHEETVVNSILILPIK